MDTPLPNCESTLNLKKKTHIIYISSHTTVAPPTPHTTALFNFTLYVVQV